MKVYYGKKDTDYLIEHITMDEIKTLVLPELYKKSVRISEEMKNPSSDN
ncbi:MAG: hypothetical protein NC393_02660 [Clostridium sp.]|nr:hypothetical protein [Clostridium sp.]MCM1171007.1 hypothetical protein [Clostridium sp.]MCM1208014.1 hypothetical protein [Ruminococcus sp.]